MKGTFISADFVEDSNGNVKFLEFNTDTSDNQALLSNNPWVNLIELISGSTLTGQEITKFHVIHKPAIHQHIVNSLSQSLANSATHITSFTEHREDIDTIYPINVTDADDTFILRLAYDENAILDSTYCKDGTNALRLFNENNDLDSAVPYYYSSSTEIINSLNTTLNPNNYPDFAVKSNNTTDSVNFFKAGPVLSGSTYVSSSEFTGERISNFTSSFFEQIQNENTVIMNYMYPSETDTDGAVSSIRTYHITYGNTLNSIHLGGYRVYAPFSLPTGSQIDWNESTSSIVAIGKNHYHEFSTSDIKETGRYTSGPFETEKIISSSGEAIGVEFAYENYSGSNIEVRTLFISGSPNTETPSEYLSWYHSGNELPSGSYVTSSNIVHIRRVAEQDFSLVGITISGSSEIQYLSPAGDLLVYESSSNETKFLPVKQIKSKNEPGYFVYGTDGTLKKIIDNEYIIVNHNTTGSFYEIDVEPNDYYFVGDNPNTFAVHHNPVPFCFPAGTRISLANGDVKNIEDMVVGDSVITFNEETGELEDGNVLSIKTPIHNDIVRYTLSDGTEIESTHDHPYYVNGLTIASYNTHKTNKLYNMPNQVVQINLNDTLTKLDKSTPKINSIEVVNTDAIQTYVIEVDRNSNYFANEILVHNKPAGIT